MGRKVIIMAPTEKEVADAHFNSTDPDMAAGWTEIMSGVSRIWCTAAASERPKVLWQTKWI